MWHSTFYLANIDYGNDDSRFFDDSTFGLDIYTDPCASVTNVDFRKKVNSIAVCSGRWCVNDTYNCVRYKTTECYNVEHIIDLNGGEFPKSCNNIAGNLVMAYGRWNSQLGSRANIN